MFITVLVDLLLLTYVHIHERLCHYYCSLKVRSWMSSLKLYASGLVYTIRQRRRCRRRHLTAPSAMGTKPIGRRRLTAPVMCKWSHRQQCIPFWVTARLPCRAVSCKRCLRVKRSHLKSPSFFHAFPKLHSYRLSYMTTVSELRNI